MRERAFAIEEAATKAVAEQILQDVPRQWAAEQLKRGAANLDALIGQDRGLADALRRLAFSAAIYEHMLEFEFQGTTAYVRAVSMLDPAVVAYILTHVAVKLSATQVLMPILLTIHALRQWPSASGASTTTSRRVPMSLSLH